jgi:hypothetical protein
MLTFTHPIIGQEAICPDGLGRVIDYLDRHRISYEAVVVSGNREAMAEMIALSGQSKAPTLDWNGQVLADFGVDELIPFLRKVNATR